MELLLKINKVCITLVLNDFITYSEIRERLAMYLKVGITFSCSAEVNSVNDYVPCKKNGKFDYAYFTWGAGCTVLYSEL